MVVRFTAAGDRTTVWVIRPIPEPIAAVERYGVAADGHVPPAAASSHQTRPAIAQVADTRAVSADLVIAEGAARYVATRNTPRRVPRNQVARDHVAAGIAGRCAYSHTRSIRYRRRPRSICANVVIQHLRVVCPDYDARPIGKPVNHQIGNH